MIKLNKKEIEDLIRATAKRYRVDPDLAVKVAECESGLNPLAVNKNPNGTLDRGLYQWNDHWHPKVIDFCAFDIGCSTMVFCEAVKAGHLNWWNATRHCWGPAYKKTLLIKIRDLLKKLVSKYKELIAKIRGL